MDHDILPRIRTIVKDLCGKGSHVMVPRLILDVIEEDQIVEFVEAVREEFDIPLPENVIDEETTFRELIELVTEP